MTKEQQERTCLQVPEGYMIELDSICACAGGRDLAPATGAHRSWGQEQGLAVAAACGLVMAYCAASTIKSCSYPFTDRTALNRCAAVMVLCTREKPSQPSSTSVCA